MKLKWQPSQPSYVSLILLRNPVAAERYKSFMSRMLDEGQTMNGNVDFLAEAAGAMSDSLE